ncbi:MAG: BlaI/MecI/CopY family transcriptional regulator [Bacteroidales bacterium]|nr:BlaI/MecI/CopY family transcriptional regulator [Bacteroidales bacterium]MBO5263175.1 BlaI/MecI/CopY family transcriptional regulator [Bacteroidaceae bacterium]
MSKGLTKREEEIMNIFWVNGPLFVKELIPFFNEPKPHINTLSTIVRGLEEKGYIAHKAYGNTYQYYAAVNKSEYGKRSLKKIISQYFKNSYLGAVSSLVEEEKISLEELTRLIEIAKKKQQK